MSGHEWADWFEREELIGHISDLRVQNLQVEREVVQKRTFTRWMNLHLEKCDPPLRVGDLFQDVQDGRVLMALLEELSGCRLLHGFKRSSHRIFRLNNIAKVLTFLEERNVKLISIDAADVADGNSSIILGLIWNIILFFQIKELTGNIRSQFPSCSSLSSLPTSSDLDASLPGFDERPSPSSSSRQHSSAIKRLLQWVQKRTRRYGVAVQDFGKSWTNGLAFLAVVKSIDPSLVDMRKALLRTPRDNLEDAFRAAHYSLGIPRLLEPEDVTVNVPDEQSIMMYVSQFLEHFPGIEEPEDSCRLTERSVSMGRLNLRDYDLELLRNGTHRSYVRETASVFQKDRVRPPPKILISSVSEDRGVMSPTFKPAVARSWVSEDLLAKSTPIEDASVNIKRGLQEHGSDVFSNSSLYSPAGSPVPEAMGTESTAGDSAIGSPESWLEKEFGVVSQAVCGSHSDGSLCDSGTSWDLNPLTDVTPEDVSGEKIPTADTDEGIHSLSSMESTRNQIQERLDDKQEEKDIRRPERKRTFMDRHQDAGPRQKDSDQISSQQEPSYRPCDRKYLENTVIVQTLEGDEQKPNQPSSNTDQKTSVTSESRQDTKQHSERVLKEAHDEPKETPEMQDNATKAVLRNHTGSEENMSPMMLNSFEINLNEAPKTVPGPTTLIKIPLSSISTDTAESNPEERPGQDRGEPPQQAGLSEGTVTETPFTSSQNPALMTSASAKGDEIPETVRGADLELKTQREDQTITLSSTSPETTDSVGRREGYCDTAGGHLATVTQAPADADGTQKDMDSGLTDGVLKLQRNLSPLVQRHGDTSEPLVTCGGGSVVQGARGVDLFYMDFGRSSPTEDLVVDLLEPMDLFYPDKEDHLFPDSSDHEMESWPSVLSVSALRPAPSSQTLDSPPPDFRNTVDSRPDLDEVIPSIRCQSVEPREDSCSSELGGRSVGGSDGSELRNRYSATQKTSWSDMQRLDENQISPRLGQVDIWSESQVQKTALSSQTQVDNVDSWCRDSWEPYVLLLLWMLLYCVWLLEINVKDLMLN